MALNLNIQPGFTLEDLDQFGLLDHLPFSLDDSALEADKAIIQGGAISPTGAQAAGLKVFFGGPRRAVSPAGTFIREYWTKISKPVRSLSPGSARFGFIFLVPGRMRSASLTGTVARAPMKITPRELPLRLLSPGAAVAYRRLRGHDWITRAV
jgi:hypothetical protein